MVAFFLGNYEMNTGLILMMLCMGTYGLFFLVLAYHYNQFSQNLFESMQQLKYLIESIDIIDLYRNSFISFRIIIVNKVNMKVTLSDKKITKFNSLKSHFQRLRTT